MQLDDRMKQLLRELGHAINDTRVGFRAHRGSDFRRARGRVRYRAEARRDNRAGAANVAGRQDDARRTAAFLESLHIRVDEEALEEDSGRAKGRNHAARHQVSEVTENFVR